MFMPDISEGMWSGLVFTFFRSPIKFFSKFHWAMGIIIQREHFLPTELCHFPAQIPEIFGLFHWQIIGHFPRSFSVSKAVKRPIKVCHEKGHILCEMVSSSKQKNCGTTASLTSAAQSANANGIVVAPSRHSYLPLLTLSLLLLLISSFAAFANAEPNCTSTPTHLPTPISTTPTTLAPPVQQPNNGGKRVARDATASNDTSATTAAPGATTAMPPSGNGTTDATSGGGNTTTADANGMPTTTIDWWGSMAVTQPQMDVSSDDTDLNMNGAIGRQQALNGTSSSSSTSAPSASGNSTAATNVSTTTAGSGTMPLAQQHSILGLILLSILTMIITAVI